METKVEELADNRVRLTVAVTAHDVKHAVEHAASDIGASMRIPGFRKGKVPMPVVVQRVGKERLMAEAVDSHISNWFWNAAARSRVQPVSQPEYDYVLPAGSDDDWSFTAVFDVQPRPELPDWSTLEVPYAEAKVPAEEVDRELERLRETVAELEPVEGRPAEAGDTAVLDLVPTPGDAQRDYVVELGGGRLLPELEQAVIGLSVGASTTVEAARSAEETMSVEITLTALKQKVLPPLDDDLARAASEFDTLAELRADVEAKLRAQLEEELDVAFRTAVVDRLVDASTVDPAGPLVEARAASAWNSLIRSIQSRGIDPAVYFQVTGQDPAAAQGRLLEESKRSVARELVLEAVAEKLSLEVSDEELHEAIRENAESAGESGDDAIEQLTAAGRAEDVRDDLRMRKALDRVAAEVKRVPADLAAIRESIWTPGTDKEESTEPKAKLWTPGGKEPA